MKKRKKLKWTWLSGTAPGGYEVFEESGCGWRAYARVDGRIVVLRKGVSKTEAKEACERHAADRERQKKGPK